MPKAKLVEVGAVLGLDVGDLGVGRGVSPDEVEVVIGVVVDIVGAQLLGEVVQLVVLPADFLSVLGSKRQVHR